ncbi:type IX secretion system membrane protein PorP/SprF [Flavobacterium sp. 7A]|uniref:PorP/SprF family type IX secretion system membrane protein n=1 Tax=Flavobacterium sp. 7A TaxID=2940571 RepID=UPI0022278A6C|nr:type IX secretion system membrane protein PorP/SprF [Flavobacterium sp. 7A]MCW2121129.1 type IX secretion system PorP/SprF family membrane protein [Flavobacterium sp. 7A]
MITKRIIFGLILLVFSIGYSQQDAQFTQYMYNTININPAYAGSRSTLNVFALHRTQWVGLDGAPVTNTASVNTPIEGTNLGLGVSVVNDKIGPSDENNISVDLSYSINTSDNYKLSFGLKATANLLNIDFTRLNQYDKNDYTFENNIDNKFSPNIGFGLYLHSDKSYVGFSIPSLLETSHFDRSAGTSNANSHVAKEIMNLYLIAGHVFDLNPDLKFKPALLVKEVQGAPLQVDLSGNFMFNDKFMIGAAYRWSAAVSAMVGFQATKSWFIGYSYDTETTNLANYNSGSHEIFLRYELFNKFNRITSPRFF